MYINQIQHFNPNRMALQTSVSATDGLQSAFFQYNDKSWSR